MENMNLIKTLIEAIRQTNKGTEPYDTTAEVLRVEDGIAWVHIPGGVAETPVEMSVDAKAGDTVRVRVSGGQAWISGNNTEPPTGDATAKKAVQKAEAAQDAVVKLDEGLSAEEIARRLTNDWQNEIIVQIDGHLFINASYIRTGELVVGGANNIDGTIVVKDAVGNTICSLTNAGINVEKGTIEGSEIQIGGSANADGTLSTYNADGNLENVIDNNGLNLYNDGDYVGRLTSYDDIGMGGTEQSVRLEGEHYVRIWTTYNDHAIAYVQKSTNQQAIHAFYGDVLLIDDLQVNGGGSFGDNVSVTRKSPCFIQKGDISMRRGAAALNSNTRVGGFFSRDSNNEASFYSETYRTTDNDTYTSFVHRRYNSDGSASTTNGFYLHIDNSGNKSVTFTSGGAAAWRKGLAVPTMTDFTISSIDITVGTLAANADKYNQTTASGIDTDAYRILGIVGYELSGSGYTRCTISKLEMSGANILWSVANLGSSATGSLTLTVKILKVAL